MKRVILILFSLLFFGIPLVFFPTTSELFEFNKIVLLYAITLGIIVMWSIESIIEKKFVFKRTLLDIPLLLFLGSQLLSTVISIDTRTSLLGYYSRFNGGLISIICYAILYWAFVTHVEKKDFFRLFVNLVASSTIAAIWGILEHFGRSPSCALITGSFDVGCWVQDVQLRVFATFGQPNWMAAWMAALIPLTWISFFTDKKLMSSRFQNLSFVLTALLTASLIFTKSKSGIGAFGVSVIVFAITILFFHFNDFRKKFSKRMLFIPLLFVAIIMFFGTPWTPTVFELQNRKTETLMNTAPQAGTSLETGGTDSGIIRAIVWRGAVNVWKQFPLLGSGVETFAFSYYRGRPMSHNLVSEWNFLYNKAHNEYLNYLATTGIIGIGTYLLVIGATVFGTFKILKETRKTEDFYIVSAIFSGYVSLLVTNFFGFSVVPTSILFYLFPAAILAIKHKSSKNDSQNETISSVQVGTIAVVSAVSLYSLLLIFNYWHADYIYARAQEAQNNEDYTNSLKYYKNAIDLEPNEALYHAQLGALYADLTTAKEADNSLIETFTTLSVQEITIATKLSPQNVRILKLIANAYATLGDKDTKYLVTTLELTQKLQVLAPTDPSVLYQQCLTLAKLDHFPEAIKACETAVSMKTDYKIARRLSAFLYEQTKQPDKAKVQLEYILKYISPDDVSVQQELKKLQ